MFVKGSTHQVNRTWPENLSGKAKFFRKENEMAMLAFFAGAIVGALMGVAIMALLSMAKDVEPQKADDLTKTSEAVFPSRFLKRRPSHRIVIDARKIIICRRGSRTAPGMNN